MSDQTDDLNALIEQMAALGISPEALGLMQHRMGYGEDMAGTPSAQGTHVGNTYVASSPLEHMAVALRRYQGQKQMADARTGIEGQLGQNRQGIAGYGRAQNALLEAQRAEARRRRVNTLDAEVPYSDESVQAPMPVE